MAKSKYKFGSPEYLKERLGKYLMNLKNMFCQVS